ncbi:hypothetical protein OSB04_024262 [Centaurea solstitialis]|uniref:Uncharacterized protein n=1 Tax=Centaurea solstitialis TaxID=347529 RepID=A0AA38SY40_9ASTR|nr:hypothetical protein OSB04_024262 [Centaurea solstitialis]
MSYYLKKLSAVLVTTVAALVESCELVFPLFTYVVVGDCGRNKGSREVKRYYSSKGTPKAWSNSTTLYGMISGIMDFKM